MARVPTLTERRVAPQAAQFNERGRASLDTPPLAAFGGGAALDEVTNAQRRLGGVVAAIGTDISEQANQVIVNGAADKLHSEAEKIAAEAQTLRGLDSVKSLEVARAKLEKVISDIESKDITNVNQRTAFARYAFGQRWNTTSEMSTFTNRELKAYDDQKTQAVIETNHDRHTAVPYSPDGGSEEAANAHMSDAVEKLKDWNKRNGVPKEKTDLDIAKLRSGFAEDRIKANLDNPEVARKLYDAYMKSGDLSQAAAMGLDKQLAKVENIDYVKKTGEALVAKYNGNYAKAIAEVHSSKSDVKPELQDEVKQWINDARINEDRIHDTAVTAANESAISKWVAGNRMNSSVVEMQMRKEGTYDLVPESTWQSLKRYERYQASEQLRSRSRRHAREVASSDEEQLQKINKLMQTPEQFSQLSEGQVDLMFPNKNVHKLAVAAYKASKDATARSRLERANYYANMVAEAGLVAVQANAKGKLEGSSAADAALLTVVSGDIHGNTIKGMKDKTGKDMTPEQIAKETTVEWLKEYSTLARVKSAQDYLQKVYGPRAPQSDQALADARDWFVRENKEDGDEYLGRAETVLEHFFPKGDSPFPVEVAAVAHALKFNGSKRAYLLARAFARGRRE